MSASAPLTYDEALDLVQQFLGDLGTVVVVDRSTRDCRFLTVQ